MLRRWASMVIAVLFALGISAGLGGASAVVSPASVHCPSQATVHGAMNPAPPMHGCDTGPMHAACVLHASSAAFMLPALAAAQINTDAARWHALPSLGLHGTRLAPDTPPPIVLL